MFIVAHRVVTYLELILLGWPDDLAGSFANV